MTKTVALSEEAYKELAETKKAGESFSDVVMRIAKKEKKQPIEAFFGIWEDDKEIGKIFDEILKNRHKFMPREVKL